MTPKQIKKLITKIDGQYAYYDNECEAWVLFHKSWSLTKCRKFLTNVINGKVVY